MRRELVIACCLALSIVHTVQCTDRNTGEADLYGHNHGQTGHAPDKDKRFILDGYSDGVDNTLRSPDDNPVEIIMPHVVWKRLADLEQAVEHNTQYSRKRDTEVSGHAETGSDGTHAGAKVDHTSSDGKTHAEAHAEHSSNGGTSYGGSFSHKIGKTHDNQRMWKRFLIGKREDNQRMWKRFLIGKREDNQRMWKRFLIGKRDTTVEGHADKDAKGTHVGGSVTHDVGNGGSIQGHVDHDSNTGTSFGVGGSKTFSHSDGSETSISGGVDHDSSGDNRAGISVSHKFGKGW